MQIDEHVVPTRRSKCEERCTGFESSEATQKVKYTRVDESTLLSGNTTSELHTFGGKACEMSTVKTVGAISVSAVQPPVRGN